MRLLSLFSVLVLTSVLSVAQGAKTEDISGLYSFVRGGDTLQINVQPDGRVTGYVSQVAEGESDRGQTLDLMFDKALLKGTDLEFHTKKVHGESFEFHGHVTRGPGKTHDDEGYFVVRGTLTTVREDVTGKPTPTATEVEFKSFPAGM
jgi:hypothetical protein